MNPTHGNPFPSKTQSLVNSLRDEELSAVLEAVYCRQELNRIAAKTPPCCSRRALIAELPPLGSKHYRMAICGSCGRVHDTLRAPKNMGRRAPSTHGLPTGPECVMCLTRTNLEVHHIHEIADGGSNSPDNRMTLCQACHALVHWLRRFRSVS